MAFSLAASALALIPAAIAASFCEAMDLYQKKDYQHAGKLFEKATKENPKDWKAHYYMGNCLYAMGRFTSAAYQYELAAQMTRNPHQVHLCQMAAYKAESTGLKSRVALTNMKTAADEARYNREAQLQTRKSQILAQADKHAAAVKQQAEAQINEERASSQKQALDGKGGMGLDISADRVNSIYREAEGHAQYIKDMAKNKADNLL